KLLVRLRAAGASYVNTSVLQTRSQIIAMLPAVASGPAGVDPAASRPAD
ncbi:MAG: hypothetical protein JWO31_2365, partial [Phycisphaerales bacterium]|nr:hypothetical protein [Phycisphaerales bacterium]